MGLSHLSAEQVAAWVAASCAAQGLPVRVSDPVVVRQVGALLGAGSGGGRERKRSGTRTAHGRVSVAPDDGHSGRVQGGDSGGAGGDVDVADDRFDDGVLPRQREVGPSPA
jgi:hypothetical protein